MSRSFSTALNLNCELTNKLDLVLPESFSTRKAFRIVDESGKLVEGAEEPVAEQSTWEKMYKSMVQLQVMDGILYEAQRQGRISFYMLTSGEEGINIGAAAGLQPEDTVFGQYRESGVLLWRGFSIQEFTDQCLSNCDDRGKGRQMPIHYGSKELNFHTISSPLTTQLPHASGAAYSLKNKGPGGPIVACFFGEGAASEGDFHPALNMASTLECPVMFICRNNQYAISTPIEDQYRGDGIVSRAEGYGMASCRVDGNDILAVRYAIQQARKYTRENCKPMLVELMSYRQGHHSTSDDSTAYRSIEEIENWKQNGHPITRFRTFLEDRKIWSQQQEDELRDAARKEVLAALTIAEEKDKPEAIENLFADVYDTIPQNLKEEQDKLLVQITKYPKHYTLDY